MKQHTSLALKYRPQKFADLIGQESVAASLASSVASGTTKQVYLFSGTRGVGKTSAARILARALNCPNQSGGEPCNQCEACQSILEQRCSDVFEIDAASYTKVDQTREVLAGVIYQPTALSYKIYIIDEAHMLSKSSFNALLKTLEEPPPHVVFVLATTEPEKIIPTVRSRCQKYHFASPSSEQLAARYGQILEAEGVEYEPEAVELIAAEASGSVRDGVSLLDQVLSGAQSLTLEAVTHNLGLVDRTAIQRLSDALIARDIQTVIDQLAQFRQFDASVSHVGHALLGDMQSQVQMRLSDGNSAVREAWHQCSTTDAFRTLELAYTAFEQALKSPIARGRLEMGLMRIATLKPLADVFHAGPQSGAVQPKTPAAKPEPESKAPQASPQAQTVAPSEPDPVQAPQVSQEPEPPVAPATEPPPQTEQIRAEEVEAVHDFKERAVNDPVVRTLREHFGGSVVSVEDHSS